jgi:predicted permease
VQESALGTESKGFVRRSATLVTRLLRRYIDFELAVAEETRRDMRYAVVSLRKSPGFALVGIISMAIGMGLTTMVYSSEWKMITRDLPAAANAKRLVMPEKPVSYYDIEQYRSQSGLFSGVAALKTGVPFNVSFESDLTAKPQRVFGQLVSADYFSVLGVRPQRGRVLSPAIDQTGDAPVVVISDRFWRNRLNASPSAIGQILRLNGQPTTIVGITPKNFNGVLALNPAELFVPTTVPAELAPELGNDVLHQAKAKEFLALICLAPGVQLESAEAALDTITRRLQEQEGVVRGPGDRSRHVNLLLAGTMVPLPKSVKPVVAAFYIALMGLIMVNTCMNLANMMLSRGANRRKELAIRFAVGATRFRIVRQLVREGILLALLGGLTGLGFAYGLAVLQSRFRPPSALPVETNFTPDLKALFFVYVLAIVCGILFSLPPALRATRADVTSALKDGSTLQLAGYRRFGIRNLLIVTQVAGSLMLLMITGFLVLGLSRASNIQTNFNAHTMYMFSIDPVRDGYPSEKVQAFFEKLPEQLKSAPAISSVTLAGQAPFSLQQVLSEVTAENAPGSSRVQISAVEETAGAGYFAALSEPVLAGREFGDMDERDGTDSPRDLPSILNESAARGLFGHGNAVGQRFRDDERSYEVVGVVHDMKNGIGISQPVIYRPLTKSNFASPPADGITIMVRSDASSDALGTIRRQIASIDPKINIFNVRTLSEELELSRAFERFSINTYGGIGIFGLVLAAVGLAGVTAYAVAQRNKEIGIRLALGSTKRRVLLLVLREGTALVAVGTVLGVSGAVLLAKILSVLANAFVEALKVGTGDLRLLIGAPLVLGVLAVLACYIPARKATKLDPLKALRQA